MSFQLANLKSISSNLKYASLILLALFSSLSLADEEDDTRTDTSKAAQKIQAKMHPMVQVPISYNYNQNTLPNQNYTQAQFQLAPFIPFFDTGDHAFVLNPMFTDNVNSQYQTIKNQATPLQISTFYTTKTPTLVYGIGPFIQLPTANTYSGSQQTGLGVSYGAFWQPKNWVVGFQAYNGFGVGGSTSAGTANVYYYNPTISYTTDSAYTYNLQSWLNGNPTNGHSQNNNQLIFSVGKTVKVDNYHVQWAIGPTYMITPTPSSPQGLGGYFSLTVAFREK